MMDKKTLGIRCTVSTERCLMSYCHVFTQSNEVCA